MAYDDELLKITTRRVVSLERFSFFYEHYTCLFIHCIVIPAQASYTEESFNKQQLQQRQ